MSLSLSLSLKSVNLLPLLLALFIFSLYLTPPLPPSPFLPVWFDSVLSPPMLSESTPPQLSNYPPFFFAPCSGKSSVLLYFVCPVFLFLSSWNRSCVAPHPTPENVTKYNTCILYLKYRKYLFWIFHFLTIWYSRAFRFGLYNVHKAFLWYMI